MANRTGTYVAFDGLGQDDPAKSDYKYYTVIRGWSANPEIDFRLTNSHEKASSVSDSSKLETLQRSIRERLAASKNMLIVLSDQTRKTGSVLSYEIEKAIDYYELPLIIAYADVPVTFRIADYNYRWPKALESRIDNAGVQAVHVPFKKDPIWDAIKRFTVNGEKLNGSKLTYSREAYQHWGLI